MNNDVIHAYITVKRVYISAGKNTTASATKAMHIHKTKEIAGVMNDISKSNVDV